MTSPRLAKIMWWVMLISRIPCALTCALLLMVEGVICSFDSRWWETFMEKHDPYVRFGPDAQEPHDDLNT